MVTTCKKLLHTVFIQSWVLEMFMDCIMMNCRVDFMIMGRQWRIQRVRKMIDGEYAFPFMVIKIISELSSENFANPLYPPLIIPGEPKKIIQV